MSSKAFDYVVVGGGASGLVVAARLAENPSVTVCVLEAGQDITHELDIEVPGFAMKNWTKDPDWTFMSVPQAAANDRSIYIPRGKGLGGSSIINLMSLGRAPAHEYDAFETLGAKGWNSKELLKYFKKSQTLAYDPELVKALGLKPSPDGHGNGPIINTLGRTSVDFYPQLVKACQEVGVPFNANAIGGENIGVWPSACAIHPETVTRISTASAYYEPIKGQGNLIVITGARATRVIFQKNVSSKGVVADGVQYSKDGQLLVVSAKKEVILAAGSILTPQILEVSGIGDKSILQAYKIPTVVDLPGVGRNFQVSEDRLGDLNAGYESFDVLFDPERAAKEWTLYEQEKRGLLSSLPYTFSFVPLKTFAQGDAMRKAAASLQVGNIHPGSFKILQSWLKDDSNKISQLENILVAAFIPTVVQAAPEPGKSYLSFSLNVAHPFARGSIHIKSNDPLVLPDIDLSVLDNPVDLAILLDSLKFARKLVKTDALKGLVNKEVAPGPGVQSDAELEEYIKNQVSTSFHPLGTASMLPRAEGGVVDSELKVYGTANLRVVDASIIPIQIATHPIATVIAIAEKAADIIKFASA
ncbi:L-sorbose 1-dehydrogenase [Hypsizygus marmoreus]|uniref:L-sorbose 1-dehydrogenase n=1 Tax=Hypsizygus marmoreus TaxID=39966 RepID=A0A369JI98_HYPMA|nr:L-sorbose 1-dehydrogenase [Hypsizygus marmoreus]